MTISLRQFEFIMNLVSAWANDLPFKIWFKLLEKTHIVRAGVCYRRHELDTAPDYEVTLVDGKPYLSDRLLGGKMPGMEFLESTASAYCLPPWTEPSLDGDISERSSLGDMD